MSAKTLGAYADAQLSSLSAAIGLGAAADEVRALLPDLLGAAARWPLNRPRWPSDIADDHSPVEFSVAFDPDGTPTLRLLIECVAAEPSPAANQVAALTAISALSARIPMSLDRFAEVATPFLAESPAAPFSVWFSLVARPNSRPMLKVYLNPAARGRQNAEPLVGDALDRLGFTGGAETIRGGLRQPSIVDHFSFFALDLDDRPDTRAKVYVSHTAATADDMRRAAGASRHGEPEEAAAFCATAAGTDRQCDGRPLISAYTFLPGDGATPSGYSLYVPVRDYVADDAEALDRTVALSTRYGLPAASIVSAVDAVRARDLAAGRGLIAHLSLRTGPPRPGMTVYLSSEAYGVSPALSKAGAA